MKELQIKLDMACEKLDRMVHCEAIVERYLHKDDDVESKWVAMSKKHTQHYVEGAYYYRVKAL